jgi:hypothetical protein
MSFVKSIQLFDRPWGEIGRATDFVDVNMTESVRVYVTRVDTQDDHGHN